MKKARKPCIYKVFQLFDFSRGRGARTPIYGFGDRCSTIELFPFGKTYVPLPEHLESIA